ncbi:CoA-acylating methylmalonate-semialdehyde dehydrogenase [Halosolutus amylolyticus]|uniref:methylmalonate-semialdehyde dehydrogenase (CoA acylating) n=1 Tax=Halosolutus amylolyticus TaxID=2932267 RepID=A0ABD5PPQ7_9EURY|nr:CoA-acylating methylmalonate-semialdehyde dehydrogenase [Halosolutus amylolyticus]
MLASLSADGEVQNYVDGSWQKPAGRDSQPVTNPATGERLATIPFSDATDLDAAVDAANEAYNDWRNTAVEDRIQPLFRLKSLLEEHIGELAELLVREHGKTRAEARGELRRGIENVEVACGMPRLQQAGTLANAAPDIDESAVREPLGTFVGITPFNFPAMISLWFLPHAVASGNAFILKPSEQDPLVTQRIFELVDQAGFPDGVVQLLNGGPDTVNEILAHPGIVGVSFVGSTPVARHIYETAAANGKRVQAQGGAKNHVIVTESTDLSYAAEKTVSSACACAGERCLSNDVVVVEDSVYDAFADEMVAKMRDQTVGYGLDDGVDIGAIISADHEETIRRYIQSGVDEGAKLLVDGRDVAVDGYEDGNFVGPSLFGEVSPEMTIVREEHFGPIVGLVRVEDFDEAVDVVNRSDFGNAASLFTDSGHKASRFKCEVEAGNLGVNVGTAAPMAFFAFGGRKDSFFGDLHAQGSDLVNFYTDKMSYIERWPDQS